MSTKTKSVAFHKEGEKLTMKANNKSSDKVALIAIAIFGIVYMVGLVLYAISHNYQLQ